MDVPKNVAEHCCKLQGQRESMHLSCVSLRLFRLSDWLPLTPWQHDGDSIVLHTEKTNVNPEKNSFNLVFMSWSYPELEFSIHDWPKSIWQSWWPCSCLQVAQWRRSVLRSLCHLQCSKCTRQQRRVRCRDIYPRCSMYGWLNKGKITLFPLACITFTVLFEKHHDTVFNPSVAIEPHIQG